MWYRQQSGSLDLAEVPAQATALQGAISLAKQANEGHRFSPAELQQAAQPLQVPPNPDSLLEAMLAGDIQTIQDTSVSQSISSVCCSFITKTSCMPDAANRGALVFRHSCQTHTGQMSQIAEGFVMLTTSLTVPDLTFITRHDLT